MKKLAIPETPQPWEERERSVTLTNGQWHDLSMFLLLSEGYRLAELDSWKELARTVKDETAAGTAAKNVAAWTRINVSVDAVAKQLDAELLGMK